MKRHEAARVAEEGSLAGPGVLVDPAAERASVLESLRSLPPADDKTATPAAKALRDVLKERLDWLDAWDQALKERRDAENPDPSPEQLAADGKADLARSRAALEQAAKDPDVLVPPTFRNLPAQVPDAVRTELKEAIEAAQGDLKEWSSKLEQGRSEPSRNDGKTLASLRARRDKTQLRVASLKGADSDAESALASAKTPEARALARERLTNRRWETRVESARLKALDARLDLEAKRADLAGLNIQVVEAHVRLAQQSLDRLKARYATLAAREERDLRRAAVREESKAQTSDDPLERYRAQRTALLLDLEAKVLKSENALATSPSPSLEEQRTLADKAVGDFTEVKHLLDDGKVSHLDALRLTNDFRRIGTERAGIVRSELTIAANRLAAAENALSDVELELVDDARDDRFEFDGLIERLPPGSHARANALFEELERKHADLLCRRRDALKKLAIRAEATHAEVQRRIDVLDEHFGFIRTHIFWVRDQEPIGTSTLVQAQKEMTQLGRAALRLVGEAFDPSCWGRISAEFLAASFGLIVLPWPLHKLYAGLKPRGGKSPVVRVIYETHGGGSASS